MIKSSLKQYSREAAVLAALFLLIIIFSMIEPVYLTPSNMIDIIKQGTINGILAIGIKLVLFYREVDVQEGGDVFALVRCKAFAQTLDPEKTLFLHHTITYRDFATETH